MPTVLSRGLELETGKAVPGSWPLGNQLALPAAMLRPQEGRLVVELLSSKPARLVRLLPRREALRALDAPELGGLGVPGDDARDPLRARQREIGIEEEHARKVRPPLARAQC